MREPYYVIFEVADEKIQWKGIIVVDDKVDVTSLKSIPKPMFNINGVYGLITFVDSDPPYTPFRGPSTVVKFRNGVTHVYIRNGKYEDYVRELLKYEAWWYINSNDVEIITDDPTINNLIKKTSKKEVALALIGNSDDLRPTDEGILVNDNVLIKISQFDERLKWFMKLFTLKDKVIRIK